MLQGVLARRQDDVIVVDIGGVGFRVRVPSSTTARLPGSGESVALHIYTHVREDTFALYGFATEDELVLFEDIISVSGMGPRLALTSLSTLQPQEFRRAIHQEDVSSLTRISGVGKKTAQRLILELKGKLTPAAEDGMAVSGVEAPVEVPVTEEALAALMALGYSEAEARPALVQVAQEADGDA